MTAANHSTSKSRSRRVPTLNSRRQRKSAELRERLFRAALTLFAKKGFTETTVEDITEAAIWEKVF
jgi:AcrR family transcriptional regulator